jgi:hypothetical protein
VKVKRLREAVNEAERFLVAAKRAETKYFEDWAIASRDLGLTKQEHYSNSGKENASCKRASLDLTRALAELRKS